MATYWGNSCSFGLRYVSWYKYLIVSLVFSHLGFWSGNLFLIAPFPDLCLLVPFQMMLDSNSFTTICTKSSKCHTCFDSSAGDIIINLHCSGQRASFINNSQFCPFIKMVGQRYEFYMLFGRFVLIKTPKLSRDYKTWPIAPCIFAFQLTFISAQRSSSSTYLVRIWLHIVSKNHL